MLGTQEVIHSLSVVSWDEESISGLWGAGGAAVLRGNPG